jgi:hypothetical protein
MGVLGCDLSEKLLKNLGKASDFQAEYEGSIPFTRSKAFNDLACERFLLRQTGLNASDKVFSVCSQRCAAPRPRWTSTSVEDQTLVPRFAMRFSGALRWPASLPCR